MQSQQNQTADNLAGPRSQSKRRLSGQQTLPTRDPSDTKSSIRQSTISEHLKKADQDPLSDSKGNVQLSASKRLKNSHGPADAMSLGLAFRPERMSGQERTSKFQPHTGAKKIVVKNLRTSRANLDAYYKQTWDELDAALTSIFQERQPEQSLERLYRGVEDTCRWGRSDELYKHMYDRIRTYVKQQLYPSILAEAGSSLKSRAGYIDALRPVLRHWQMWSGQTILMRSIFSYLDRSYLLFTKDLAQLNDVAIEAFREAVFPQKAPTPESLSHQAIEGMAYLVHLDRKNDVEGRNGIQDLFDGGLLKGSVTMVHVLGTYNIFETYFLQHSREYFQTFAERHLTSSLRDYVSSCEKLIYREALRCDTYNFDSSTKRALQEVAQKRLVLNMTDMLLKESSVAELLDTHAIGSLRQLYDLLKLSQIHQQLKAPWEAYIKSAGAAIVGDKERGDEMVVRLLEMKRGLEVVIRDAFHKDDFFTYSLREAFGNFINDRKAQAVWGAGNSKVGEMIAKYIDLLLRGGLKAVPRSLISDAKDRDAAEKRGEASTGDEDAELDRQLDQGLELFRFIEGKDVFEAFYKKDLARRLLMGRSASQDAERSMLSKLKGECGSSFTHNLEQMFKDQEMAREEMISYKQSLSNTSKTTLDLQVSVLSASAWPTYPDVKVNLPDEVQRHLQKYEAHYLHKHTGRRLTWKHALAHSVVKAKFPKGVKELQVSGFQAIVLALFNNLPASGTLTYASISSSTSLPAPELKRTLQSLACAKLRVLNKLPKGKEVSESDTFSINEAFSDPKFRIKINQIQLKETKEENKETHERVQQDRQYETQAAIVRIMKGRKTITHAGLVAEVIGQTKSRGAVEVGEIKMNIEKLIEKDYIEREEDGTYTYLA